MSLSKKIFFVIFDLKAAKLNNTNKLNVMNKKFTFSNSLRINVICFKRNPFKKNFIDEYKKNSFCICEKDLELMI